MSIGETISLIGLILTWVGSLVGFSWAVARWAGARIDAVRRDTDEKVAEIHSRINGLAAALVPRQEMLDHLGRIEGGLGTMNARMDTIITSLAIASKQHKV